MSAVEPKLQHSCRNYHTSASNLDRRIASVDAQRPQVTDGNSFGLTASDVTLDSRQGLVEHRPHIRIDPNLKSNFGNYDRKAFTFKFSGISSKTDEGASNCETIIHECTHACVDYKAGLQVFRTDNEIAAWFDGVLFLRGQSLPITGEPDFRKNLRALANDARKANVRGQIFTLPPAAVAALKSDIVHASHIPEGLKEVGRGF